MKNTLLGAALFLVAARTAEGRIEPVFIERLPQPNRFHDVGMHIGAMRKRPDAITHALLVDMHQKFKPLLTRLCIAEFNHLTKFPCRIHMEKGKRQRGGIERLHRQMQHDGGILADRIEHHRIGECRRHLTENMDGFCFKALQMRQVFHQGCMMHGIYSRNPAGAVPIKTEPLYFFVFKHYPTQNWRQTKANAFVRRKVTGHDACIVVNESGKRKECYRVLQKASRKTCPFQCRAGNKLAPKTKVRFSTKQRKIL
ncbi:hypothetical protein B3286c1_0490 [Brucella vulpis]|nr:hypothetical protein BF3285c1_0491 [Brucella vulpis]CUW49323.1 hypothetical protein B3286c1_0490 [Brucella vulpis]